MKNLITFLIIAAATLAATSIQAQTTSSSREVLAAQEDVSLLYTVDETHSFVIGTPSLVQAEGARVIMVYGTGKGGPLSAYMVEHSSPQPLVYKNPLVRATGAVAEGTTELGVELLASEKDALTAIDLYQAAYNTCAKSGGEATLVVPKTFGKYKRLVETSALDAFNYVLMNGDNGGAWYFSCSGPRTFTVMKNYRFLTGEVETAEVRYGCGLGGVNYARADEAPISQTVLYRDGRYDNSTDRETFLAEMARQVAELRFSLLKPHDGAKYLGSYRSTSVAGCDMVTIKHLAKRAVEKDNVAKVFEFKVCPDKVAMVGEHEVGGTTDTGKTIYAQRPGASMMASVGK